LVWLGECADLFNKGKPRWARVSRKVSLGAVLVWGLAVTLIGAGMSLDAAKRLLNGL